MKLAFLATKAMNDILSEIRDANLTYLMLAQRMIREDKASAIFRLGLSKEIVEIVEGLSTSQVLKLASANSMLFRFRFDDNAILDMLNNYSKKELVNIHTSILLSCQPVEEIS